MPTDTSAADEHDDIMYPSAIPFVLVHLVCFAAIWTGVTWQALAICVALYWLRIFGIGAGYHRYFSHRAYTTGRVFQFILAFIAQSTTQKSVLWWAAKHRHHHLFSDTEHDVHSPRHKGFFYSHLGWIFARRHDTTDLVKVADLARYPELMLLHRFEQLPGIIVGTLCFLIGGWSGLVIGFFWSTVLVYHATFCINSLAHVHGKKRYVTGDDSRNNWLLAFFTMGEGWHNNHHAYQSSVRQGFKWWEIDPTYYILRGLSFVGVVWDLKTPPEQVLRNEQKLGSRVINRAAEDLAARFNSERVAAAIAAALHGPELTALQDALSRARDRTTQVLATQVLANWHLPHMPSREEFLAEAKIMFARTPSLDDIINRAYEIVLASVGSHLAATAPARS
ncbi:acyl-CoA desaturase [Bradyrhizobium prioriisuperbiae]|uniref:acyl-CoA desaturase n=1 Tax=Bradyrhizobium prioriisuperbiae TaxID=2854389 RepID=UPI0028E62868|nr:acyl-CoA desaturase [Bradyrhizobium prioritasuperba]